MSSGRGELHSNPLLNGRIHKGSGGGKGVNEISQVRRLELEGGIIGAAAKPARPGRERPGNDENARPRDGARFVSPRYLRMPRRFTTVA